MINYQDNEMYYELDTMILSNYSDIPSLKNAKNRLNSFDKIDIAALYVKDKEHKQKWTWYAEEKKMSTILGSLIDQEWLLKKYNITIEKAILIICSLYNFCNGSINTKVDTYFKVPDRFLRYRSQLSRKTIRKLLFILKRTDILELKQFKDGLYIKLNKNLISKDLYILKRAKREKRKDAKKLLYCAEKYNRYYYEAYSYQTALNQLRKAILGISMAYSQLMEKEILNKRYEDSQLYGERKDIKYIEVPVHLIAHILNISESKITRYLRILVKSCNYIAKHDKVYVKTNNMDNYYNDFYKQFDLLNTKETKLDNDHPIITKNSYILFMDNFEKTKTYYDISKHLQEYKDLIIETLELNQLEIDLNTIQLEENDKDDDITHFSKGLKTELDHENKKSEYVYRNDTSVIRADKIKGSKKQFSKNYRRVIVDFDKLSINSALNYLKKSIKKIYDYELEEKEFNHHKNLIIKLTNWVQEKLNKCNKNSDSYKNIKNLIYDSNLGYNFVL